MDGHMIIPKLFNETSCTLEKSGEDLQLRYLHAILGWDGSKFIDIKPDYAYALEHEIPFVTDCDCVLLICGDNSYWKRQARIVLAVSSKPLNKVPGLKKAGVSERGGVIDLGPIISAATGENVRLSVDPPGDTYIDRERVFCCKVTALHRINSISQDTDNYEADSLSFIAQVKTILQWVGVSGKVNADSVELVAEVLGSSAKRMLGLRRLIESSESVDSLISRMIQPAFLARDALNRESEVVGLEEDYPKEKWFRLRQMMNTSEELISEGVSLDKTKSGYFSPAYYHLNYVIKSPDTYWLKGLAAVEAMARDTDFKSRKKADREAKQIITAARKCSLRGFREQVLAEPCMFRVHILSGESLDEFIPDLFESLEYFKKRVIASYGSAPLSRIVLTLKHALDASSDEVKHKYRHVLPDFAKDRYQAVNEFCELVKAETWVKERDVAQTVFDLVIELETSGYKSEISRVNLLALASGLDCDVLGDLGPRYLALMLRK
jgi:hypothetical protein